MTVAKNSYSQNEQTQFRSTDLDRLTQSVAPSARGLIPRFPPKTWLPKSAKQFVRRLELLLRSKTGKEFSNYTMGNMRVLCFRGPGRASSPKTRL